MSTLQVRVPAQWTGSPWAARLPRLRERQLSHLLLAVVFFALYAAASLARWVHFASPSWDLGIFTESVKGYAHFRAPVADIKGPGFNALGDHFSPVLALLALLWCLWPSPVMLLIVQDALFAWSVGVVSETASRFLPRERALLIGASYGLSFGMQRAVDVEFHEIAFAIPLLAVVCRQMLLRRWWRALWWAAPLIAVKEDMPITIAAVGALVAWQARDWPRARRWTVGAGTVAAGIAVAAAVMLWVVPHFNQAHRFDYWAVAPGGAHHRLHWSVLWAPFTRFTVWQTMVWTFGITGFVCLRSPLLLLAVPTMLWRFTSDNSTYWGTYWHYSAVLMPVVFLAAVDGLDRCAESRRLRVRRYGGGVPAGVLGVALAMTVALPTGAGFLIQRDTWRISPHEKALAAAVRVIPGGATVECGYPLLARLAARDTVYWPGGDRQPPQFIVDDGGAKPEDVLRWARDGHHRDYRVVSHREKVTVIELQP